MVFVRLILASAAPRSSANAAPADITRPLHDRYTIHIGVDVSHSWVNYATKHTSTECCCSHYNSHCRYATKMLQLPRDSQCCNKHCQGTVNAETTTFISSPAALQIEQVVAHAQREDALVDAKSRREELEVLPKISACSGDISCLRQEIQESRGGAVTAECHLNTKS